MNDDEKKDVETTDEDAQSAGPVAEEDSSPSQAAGEEPSSTPAAEDASPADDGADEVPADTPSDEQEPDAAAEEAGPSEDPDMPWKDRRRLQKSRRPNEPGPQLSPEERA